MDDLARAAEIIRDADALLICAGAGMGVDSGLPDFRGTEGFWRAYPPLQKLGVSFEEIATPHWFDDNPRLAWGFYGHRLNLYRQTVPHDGFGILKKWADAKLAGYLIFTSNVDGQFVRAGFDGQNIVECHGSLHHAQCHYLCTNAIWPITENILVDEETLLAANPLPLCPHCGRIARPNILMFGDWAWESSRTDAQEIRMRRMMQNWWNDEVRIVLVECGAGRAIPTVRTFAENETRNGSATLIRLNIRESMVPGAPHIGLAMGARDALQEIDTHIRAAI